MTIASPPKVVGKYFFSEIKAPEDILNLYEALRDHLHAYDDNLDFGDSIKINKLQGELYEITVEPRGWKEYSIVESSGLDLVVGAVGGAKEGVAWGVDIP